MSDESRILTITDKALGKLLEVRDREPDSADLGLLVQVAGIRGNDFAYEMHLVRLDAVGPDDHLEDHGDLTVVIPQDSAALLRGAILDVSRDLLNPGLTIDNPNGPSPRIEARESADLSGPVAQRVEQVIREQINPQIAAHGGWVELVAVEDEVAYVRLGGGCQGCGLAPVTLSQGIEQAIVALVPEVLKVMDVTDHAAGTNPYYESAKK